MRLRRYIGASFASLVMALAGLVAACGSSQPAAMTATSAIASTWTTFFNGATSVAEKAAVLQGGAQATADIRLFFALLPATLTTEIDAIQVNGTSATVTYDFFAGARKLSTQPMTGIAVLVDNKWLVSQASWSAWVRKSDIHGSG